MNKISREDLSWRILSLLLAMTLWLFVINTQNPTQPQTIKNISVTIKGLDALEAQGYVLKNEEEIKNQMFSVTIRGPRLEIDKVYNENAITATLNLNQYLSDLTQDSVQCIANYTVDIILDGHSITVTEKKAQYTSIVLEREASMTTSISYKIAEGTTKDYELLADPVLNPTTIEIKGARSAISEVATAVVNIDGSAFSEESLVQRLPVTIYNSKGEEITGLVTSPQTVEVRLLIGKFKRVPLKVRVIGKAQEGYVYKGTQCEPQVLTIVGKAEVVDKINEITLESIDISQFVETSTVSAKLNLPDGITTSSAKAVNVTVQIDKKNNYIYNVPVSLLNIDVQDPDNGFNYEILSSEIQVGISATADEILAYNAAQIAHQLKGSLNLAGYDEGEYTLPLKLQVTDKFKVLNDSVDLEIKITKDKTQEEVENPNPEETSETTEAAAQSEISQPENNGKTEEEN